MIVTRRRKKPFPWKRVAVPATLIALIAAVLCWAPSRNWVATGPLEPAWTTVTAPFDQVGQTRTISAQNASIASLQQQLADARSQIADRDKQISQLQTQLNDAQQTAASAPSNKARAAVAQSTAAPAAAGLSAQATPDMRRTAAVWSAMDSEAAAKIVQRLPQDYVARVFALMSPDSVGAILENVPSSFAARLTQEHPELNR